jgi:hypothetical protein
MMSAVKLVLRPVSALSPVFSMMGVLVGLCALGACFLISSAPALAAASEFGAEGEGTAQMIGPFGVAVDQQSGAIYATDRGNNRVERWTGGGAFQLAWGWGVADGTTSAFQLCKAECHAGIPGSGAGQFGERPEGAAVDNSLGLSHGDVYIADGENHRIEKFSEAGEFLLAFGGEVNETTKGDVCLTGETCGPGVSSTESGAFQGLVQDDIATDSAGAVYVGDINRVQKFSPGGAIESEIPLPGVGGIDGLAVNSIGDLYVIGSEIRGVHKYNQAGVELGAPLDVTETHGQLITIGPSDEVFVADQALQHIFEYDAGGSLVLSLPEARAEGGIALLNAENKLAILQQGAIRELALPPPGPLILEGSEGVGEVHPQSADLHVTVNPEGGSATAVHFEYGTTTSYGESTPASAPLNPVDEVQSVTVAASGGAFTLAFEGESSAEIPFNATAAEVQAALAAIPAVGAGQVAVSGEAAGPWSVQFTGTLAGENVTELSASAASLTGPPEPSASVATTTPGVSLLDDREVSAALTALQPNTLYHYRAVATNSASQTTIGPDATFQTLPAVSIDSQSASLVTGTSAVLGAELNPHGLATGYRFEYGTTASYGNEAPTPDGAAGEGVTDRKVTIAIQHLEPDTTYHYRVVAYNGLGEREGLDQTFVTQGEPATSLLDGRAPEQVSPEDKHGISLEGPPNEGGVIQAAENGEQITYFAKGPIDHNPPANRSIANSQLLSARGPAGWSTQDISTPHEEIAGLTVGKLSEYKAFSNDLGIGLVEPFGATPLSAETTERTPYRREADGVYVPLVTAANVQAGIKFAGEEVHPDQFGGGVTLDTASPDAKHVLLSSPSGLTAGLPEKADESLFEWNAGSLTLVSVFPNGAAASAEGLTAEVGDSNESMRHAISNDGTRVYFSAGTGLYLRDVARAETLRIDLPVPGARGVPGGAGTARFAIASSDGSRVFFTDTARLTVGATARENEPDLYECDVTLTEGHLACHLLDVTVSLHPGEPAFVQGTVIGADENATHVFFAASGALTAGAAHGECHEEEEHPVETVCNLYEYDAKSRELKLVAAASNIDAADWGGGDTGNSGRNLGALTARVSPNGRFLAFMSRQSLTGFDNRDVQSGERDEEVFLYDSSGATLVCVSCSSTQERPEGVDDTGITPDLLVDRAAVWKNHWLAGSLPAWSLVDLGHGTYQPRYLSDNGRLFFNAATSLVPGDSNGKEDVYEYEPDEVGACSQQSGCVALMSGGSSGEESAFLDASTTGDDAFMITAAKLTTTDRDGSLDIYDARVCVSAGTCPVRAAHPTEACNSTDACRPALTPQPDLFTALPPTSTLTTSGNVSPVPATKAPTKRTSAQTKAEKLAKALKACKKNKNKKKRSRCEKTAHKRYGRGK